MNDGVLAEGLPQLPPEYFRLRGQEILGKLKQRRDKISAMAERYYAYLSRLVDVQCTNQNEKVTIAGFENGDLEVSVAALQPDQPVGSLYFHRRFRKSETEEVRIYLQGGDDLVITQGKKGGHPHPGICSWRGLLQVASHLWGGNISGTI
jgi:hypothetical protein